MKKETLKILVTIFFCALGGFLIGFNAGNLHTPLGIALFVVGLAILSMSPIVIKLIFTEKQK